MVAPIIQQVNMTEQTNRSRKVPANEDSRTTENTTNRQNQEALMPNTKREDIAVQYTGEELQQGRSNGPKIEIRGNQVDFVSTFQERSNADKSASEELKQGASRHQSNQIDVFCVPFTSASSKMELSP